MHTYRLAFLGFGNVGRALARLFLTKDVELVQRYQVRVVVTGITTGRHGMALDPQGIDLERALATQEISLLSRQPAALDMHDFIRRSGADVLFENSPVNYGE
jgi:homoserine dehydrogenase